MILFFQLIIIKSAQQKTNKQTSRAIIIDRLDKRRAMAAVI